MVRERTGVRARALYVTGRLGRRRGLDMVAAEMALNYRECAAVPEPQQTELPASAGARYVPVSTGSASSAHDSLGTRT
jgi:hypothetical protein